MIVKRNEREPFRRYRGGVAIDRREFVIQAGDGSRVSGERVYGAGMLSARTYLLGVAVAVDPGLANLTIELWDEPAPVYNLDEWDAAAELTYEFEESAAILTAFSAAPPEIRAELDSFLLDPGVYRVRAYGRETGHTSVPKTEDDLVDDWDYDPDDPDPNYDMHKHPEDILLQLWIDSSSNGESVILKDGALYVAF